MTLLTDTKTAPKSCLTKFVLYGWGGGIRTPECQDQNLVPYHLATPHRIDNREIIPKKWLKIHD